MNLMRFGEKTEPFPAYEDALLWNLSRFAEWQYFGFCALGRCFKLFSMLINICLGY